MNTAEILEDVRIFLGWTFQDLSLKLEKYEPEFLKKVHEGRPFLSVEKELIMTYIQGLAELAVYLVFGGQVQGDLREKLVAKFMQIVHRNNLSLEGAKMLVERVSSERVLESSFRTQTMDVNVGIDIAWEEILEEIVRELNRPGQGSLFEGDYVGTEVAPATYPIEDGKYGLESSLSPSANVLKVHQSTSPKEQYVQCPRCLNEQPWNLDCKCRSCGYLDIHSQN